MSAPELPDIFGNYTLGEDFVEVVSPESVDWMPQTAGWAWLALILSIFLLRWAWRRARRWYRNRYRREALAKLSQLDTEAAPEQWLGELNKLLKLTALAGFPRAEVAQLYGERWTAFLDRQCEPSPFSAQQRAMLSSGPYSGQVPQAHSRAELLAACRTWVSNHSGAADV